MNKIKLFHDPYGILITINNLEDISPKYNDNYFGDFWILPALFPNDMLHYF